MAMPINVLHRGGENSLSIRYDFVLQFNDRNNGSLQNGDVCKDITKYYREEMRGHKNLTIFAAFECCRMDGIFD